MLLTFLINYDKIFPAVIYLRSVNENICIEIQKRLVCKYQYLVIHNYTNDNRLNVKNHIVQFFNDS